AAASTAQDLREGSSQTCQPTATRPCWSGEPTSSNGRARYERLLASWSRSPSSAALVRSNSWSGTAPRNSHGITGDPRRLLPDRNYGGGPSPEPPPGGSSTLRAVTLDDAGERDRGAEGQAGVCHVRPFEAPHDIRSRPGGSLMVNIEKYCASGVFDPAAYSQ